MGFTNFKLREEGEEKKGNGYLLRTTSVRSVSSSKDHKFHKSLETKMSMKFVIYRTGTEIGNSMIIM